MEKGLRRSSILVSVVLMTLVTSVDGRLYNVSMPTIAAELGVTTQSITWMVTIYLLVQCTTVLVFGRLGDTYGLSEVFLFGVSIFTVASLFCALSYSISMLIISRGIQGLGASAVLGSNMGLISHVYSKKERNYAIAIIGAVVSVGNMLGPAIGGMIIEFIKWRVIFILHVPVCFMVALVCAYVLPKTEHQYHESLDAKGALLTMVFILLVFAFANGGDMFLGSTLGFVILVFGGVNMLLLFVPDEVVKNVPFLEMRLFKSGYFLVSIITGFMAFFCAGGYSIMHPFYLQNAMGNSAFQAGVLLMVFPIVLTVMTPISNRLTNRFSIEVLSFAGLGIMAVGLLLMMTFSLDSIRVINIIISIIFAIGNGLFQATNNVLTMQNIEEDRLGMAGSVNSLARNFGTLLGMNSSVNALYYLMGNTLGYRVDDYVAGQDGVFIDAMSKVYLGLAGLCLLTAVFLYNNIYKKRHPQTTA